MAAGFVTLLYAQELAAMSAAELDQHEQEAEEYLAAGGEHAAAGLMVSTLVGRLRSRHHQPASAHPVGTASQTQSGARAEG